MAIPFDERSRSIPGIVIDLIGQFTTLLRQESQLARAEISENLNRALIGVVMAVAAAVLLIPALVVMASASPGPAEPDTVPAQPRESAGKTIRHHRRRRIASPPLR